MNTRIYDSLYLSRFAPLSRPGCGPPALQGGQWLESRLRPFILKERSSRLVRMGCIKGKSLHASQIESRFSSVAAFSLALLSNEFTVKWPCGRLKR